MSENVFFISDHLKKRSLFWQMCWYNIALNWKNIVPRFSYKTLFYTINYLYCGTTGKNLMEASCDFLHWLHTLNKFQRTQHGITLY